MRAIFCVVFALAWLSTTHAQPVQSLKFRNDFIRIVHSVWGLQAPVAVMAGQIEQESGWRTHVRSPYAAGLAQFTPDTAREISKRYPELMSNDVYDPRWAMIALARYDLELYRKTIEFSSRECDRWGFTLSGYNGGFGWFNKDRKLAALNNFDPSLWFGHVERYSSRRDSAALENRSYVRAIIMKRQWNYKGWGRTVC